LKFFRFITGALLLVSAVGFTAGAQEQKKTMGVVEGKDTLIYKTLDEIWVFPEKHFKSPAEEKDYWRYVYKVKKVYPYAKTAAELLKMYEPEYEKLKTQREKRKFMNKIEDELMARYKNELKRLTVSEGRILIKLVDRETNQTIYSLVKDFRGDFSAFFWQTLAKLFGNNLKDQYDPIGSDFITEQIVRMIEMGYI
jgi:hypothetical protein